jgi:hypothetical protein
MVELLVKEPMLNGNGGGRGNNQDARSLALNVFSLSGWVDLPRAAQSQFNLPTRGTNDARRLLCSPVSALSLLRAPSFVLCSPPFWKAWRGWHGQGRPGEKDPESGSLGMNGPGEVKWREKGVSNERRRCCRRSCLATGAGAYDTNQRR